MLTEEIKRITNNPKVSIGMPVFNGEKSLRRVLDSLLSQTFNDFELIISDNCSTDSTPEICKFYAMKDNRIRIIRHEKNFGAVRNFHFVLNEAKREFFMWAAADDQWDPEFIEKNLKILANKNIVGSISKVKTLNLKINENKVDALSQKFLRRIVFKIKPTRYHSITGSYENKVSDFLKNGNGNMVYGLFRTLALQKSKKDIDFGIGFSYATMLHVLRYGDFHVIDEILFSKSDEGISKTGMINMTGKINSSFLGKLFPAYQFTFWSMKNLGSRLFLKNLSYFIQLNLWTGFAMLVDLIRICFSAFNSHKNNIE